MVLREGLHEIPNTKIWIITVQKQKYLYVGSETNARLTMNDLSNEAQEQRDSERERTGKRALKTEITGTMKELKALSN